MRNSPTGSFILICILLIPAPALSQEQLLGKIEFPVSGSAKAQADFIKGVLFLHNFEYADAARSFRTAQKADPDFAMAWWGEAMTYNHPIWKEQFRDKAIKALNRLAETPAKRQAKAPTQREKDYLTAIEILYGNTPESKGKSKEERDFLYMGAMKQLHEEYPEDHEALAFYGLSILGTAHEGRDYGIYMRAAAELFDVWNENQRHPGAAHYLIHSFDDPIHAPLGLPMAKAYSKIAPAAAHAQHMTSHIFLAMGMWDDVVNANIVARDVQISRQRELGEQTTVCGHYPWWLHYGYLQQGNTRAAREVLQTCTNRITNKDSSAEEFGELWHFGVMLSHQIIDTEDWQSISKWKQDDSARGPGARNYYFTSSLAALKNGKLKEAEKYLENLENMSVSDMYDEDRKRDIQVLQIQSLLLIENGEDEKALANLDKATRLESELPVGFGPPTVVKPSYELLGDVLLDLGMHAKAMAAYEEQLARTPERRRSVLGRKRARESGSAAVM